MNSTLQIQESFIKRLMIYLEEFKKCGINEDDLDDFVEICRCVNAFIKNIKFTYIINDIELALMNGDDMENYIRLNGTIQRINEIVKISF